MAGNGASALLRDLNARIQEKRRELEQKQKELDVLLGQKRELEGSRDEKPGQSPHKRQKVGEAGEKKPVVRRAIKDLRIVAEFGQQMGKAITMSIKTSYTDFLAKLGAAIGWDCSGHSKELPQVYYFGTDGDPIAVVSDQCYSVMLELYQSRGNPGEELQPWRVVVRKRGGPNDPLPIVAIPPHEGYPYPSLWKQVKILGRGAFGQVWMGLKYDLTLIAVKVLDLGTGSFGARRKVSFENERTLLKDLSHDNVVKYLSSKIVWDTTAMIWMEYVPGGSLDSILKACGTIEEDLARRFARQILQGLAYLHERHVVHCDLKPGNVLINEHGVVKLSDFGESLSHVGEYFSSKKPRGTISYIAPELAQSKPKLNGKIDIWSLGMTVFQMLTGKLPMEDLSNDFAKLRRITRMKEPPPLPDHLSSIAREFLRQCLEIDADKRPNAADLLLHPFVQLESSWSAFGPSAGLSPPPSRHPTSTLPPAAHLGEEAPANANVGGAGLSLQRTRSHIASKLPHSEQPGVYMKEGMGKELADAGVERSAAARAGGGADAERTASSEMEAAEEEHGRRKRTASAGLPYEWRYLHHENWEVYDTDAASQIEAGFQSGQASVRVRIKEEEYEMRLAPASDMRQRNLATGYERKVMRLAPGKLKRFARLMVKMRQFSSQMASTSTTVARPAQEEDVLNYVKSKVHLEENEALTLKKQISSASTLRASASASAPSTPAAAALNGRGPLLLSAQASATSPPDGAGMLKRSHASAASVGPPLPLARSNTLAVQVAHGDEELVPAAALAEGGSHAGWQLLARLDIGNIFTQTGPAHAALISRTASHLSSLPNRPTVAQQWTVFVRSSGGHSLASLIQRVTFDLHPNQPNAHEDGVIEMKTEPFEATRWSLGSFELAVRVLLHGKGNAPLSVKHWLCLSESGGWSDRTRSTQDDSFPLTHYVLCRPPEL